MTQRVSELTMYALTGRDPFAGSDALWSSFQEGVENYVDTHGGNATIAPPTYRPDWEAVKQVLEGDKSIESLGCK